MTDDNATELDFSEAKQDGRFRQLNARWPWLKCALFLLLGALVALVGFMMFHKNSLPDDYVEGGQYSSIMLKPPEKVALMDLTGKKLIALTFDDGPSSATTPRLLDILAEKQVHATFFVVGNMAYKNIGILQREKAEGHEIGSHSTGHQNLARLSAAELTANMNEMETLFQSNLGQKVQIMRPPYGALSQLVYDTMPYPMILWSIDPEDWKYRDAGRVRSAVVGAAYDGAVILVHDIHSTTVDAVAGIIDDLRAQGYEFLTISELAKVRGVDLSAGYRYGSFRP